MNNMGNIGRLELKAFADHVFKELDLGGWQIEWVLGKSYCLREEKLILIHVHTVKFRIYPGYPWQAKETVLHEIAHVFTSDKTHGVDFYREYIKLLKKFMVEEPI